MADVLDHLRLFIEAAIEGLGYSGIMLVMLLENLFPPIPSELVMPFAGFLVADGVMSFPAIVAAGTAGSVLGALILYYIGLWANEPLLRRFVRRYGRFAGIAEADLNRGLEIFAAYGPIIVFLARLMPVIRSLISLPAGMNRMPLVPFLFFTTIGSALWNAALGYGGVLLGENWPDILEFVDRYQQVTLGLAALTIIVYVLRRIRSARSKPDQEEATGHAAEAD